MPEIRPARAADALCLAGRLAQLGYPSELDAVTSRLAGILKSATRQILVAAPPDDSRMDVYVGLAAAGRPAAYIPLPLRGGEQRHNADPVVAAGGALLVDDADLDPAWIEATLIPVLADPGRIAAMSARASAVGAPDADVVLARHVLIAVAERRVVAP